MLGLSVKLQRDCRDETLSNLKWSAEKPRKHWRIFQHCNDILIPKSLRNLPLLTDESKYYWHTYISNGNYELLYEKNLDQSLRSTLEKTIRCKKISLKHIVLSEQLIQLGRFDLISRKNFIRNTAKLIKKQSGLEIVCLEGLNLIKEEAYTILAALATSRKSIKFLYLWHLYKKNEYSISKEKYLFECSCPPLDCIHDYHWFRAVKYWRCLETLSVNYAYIASESGDILIDLARQLKKHWRCLQLLCLEEEIPGTVNQRGNRNAVAIPDKAWLEARKWSPKLKVHMILFQLYLNLWNHREMLDNHLRKIFPSLPNLQIFEFLGEVKDLVTISVMCCQIKMGVCDVRNLTMQLQKPAFIKKYSDDWLSRVNELLICFKDDFQRMGVIFKISSYPY